MAKQEEVKTINYTGKTNQKRISKDEEELQELLKKNSPEAQGEEDDDSTPKGDKEEDKEQKQEKQSEDDDDSKLSAEEKTFKKRYGDLRRHVESLNTQLKELKERKPGVDDLPATEEELEEWRKEHPKVYSRVEAIAKGIAEQMIADQEDRFKRLEEMEESTRKEKALQDIQKVHSDFKALKNSDEFHQWAEEQPKWVQDALYENDEDARSVIRVIDLYKADKGMTPAAKKEGRKEALADVKTGKTRPDDGANSQEKSFSESQIKKMSDREFEENLEAINKAKREGRLVYDLS